MSIFYDHAIRVSANGEPIDWLRQEHLSDWLGLATALDRLTPEQRCDAIYADWLLQLPPAANAPRRRFDTAVRLDAKGLPGQRQLLFSGSGN